MSELEKRNYVMAAMHQRRGDDLERANMAFQNMTDAELKQPWGQSGKACREVWQEYKDHAAKHSEVWAWLQVKGII